MSPTLWSHLTKLRKKSVWLCQLRIIRESLGLPKNQKEEARSYFKEDNHLNIHIHALIFCNSCRPKSWLCGCSAVSNIRCWFSSCLRRAWNPGWWHQWGNWEFPSVPQHKHSWLCYSIRCIPNWYFHHRWWEYVLAMMSRYTESPGHTPFLDITSGADPEFGNGGFFTQNYPCPPTMIDHTHQ